MYRRGERRVFAELKQSHSAMKRLKAATNKFDAVVAVMKFLNFIESGEGYKTCDFEERQNKRFNVLDQVRSVSKFSAAQANQWVAFRTKWDEYMATTHQENWDSVLLDILITVVTELVENTPCALAEFMEFEKERCHIYLSPEGDLLPHGVFVLAEQHPWWRSSIRRGSSIRGN